MSARLSPDDGRVLISAVIHDAKGNDCGELVDNEWAFDPEGVWDLESAPQMAKARSGPGSIQFSIDTRRDEVRVTGTWKYRDRLVQFSPSMAMIGTNRIDGFRAENCGGFIDVG